MKVALRLVARAENHIFKSEISDAENVSAGGFSLCLHDSITEDAVVEVYLSGKKTGMRGKARVTRKEASSAPRQKLGFQFIEKTEDWLLQ